jgi:hypothetical protein
MSLLLSVGAVAVASTAMTDAFEVEASEDEGRE